MENLDDSVTYQTGSPDGLKQVDGYERHFLGRFGEKVVAYLSQDLGAEQIGEDEFYIFVDSIELGDSPLGEELGIKFHFSESPPPPNHVPYWGAFAPAKTEELDLSPDMEPVLGSPSYWFTFTSEINFEENKTEFSDFIKKAIDLMTGNQSARGEDLPSARARRDYIASASEEKVKTAFKEMPTDPERSFGDKNVG